MTDYTTAFEENLRGHDLVGDESDVYVIEKVYEDTVYTQGKGDVLFPFIQLKSILTGRTMPFWKVNGPTRKYILQCGFNNLNDLRGVTVQVYYQHIKVRGSGQGYMTVYPNKFVAEGQNFPLASPPSMGLDQDYDNEKIKREFLANAKHAFSQAGIAHPIHGGGEKVVKKQTASDIKRVVGAAGDLYGMEDKELATGEALGRYADVQGGTTQTLTDMTPNDFLEFKSSVLGAWKAAFDSCKQQWDNVSSAIGDDEIYAQIRIEAFGKDRGPKTLAECRAMHKTETAQKQIRQIVGIIESQPNYTDDVLGKVLGEGITEITDLIEACEVLEYLTDDAITGDPITKNQDVPEVEF